MGHTWSDYWNDTPDIMDMAKEGKHFCTWCNKMIRDGEEYYWHSGNKPRTRDSETYYWHAKCAGAHK